MKKTLKTIVLVWAAITIVALYVASTPTPTNNRAAALCQPHICIDMGAK